MIGGPAFPETRPEMVKPEIFPFPSRDDTQQIDTCFQNPRLCRSGRTPDIVEVEAKGKTGDVWNRKRVEVRKVGDIRDEGLAYIFKVEKWEREDRSKVTKVVNWKSQAFEFELLQTSQKSQNV